MLDDLRFYRDLAAWWPLISPPGDYEEEAAFAAKILRTASIPVCRVLELGSGGGHNAFHLKREFEMTLVDLSGPMLDASRLLNPECRHELGDMRSARLGETFDAVFIHDAIDYMTTATDLGRAIETAFKHCRPGGLVFLLPDHIRETFEESTGHGGGDSLDGRSIRYLEWTWDPDSADSWVQTEYSFLLRTPDGRIESHHETHRTGLFSRDEWLQRIAEAGFEPSVVPEETSEERPFRELFVGRQRAGGEESG